MGMCSLAKQIQSSYDKTLHCHEILVRMQIPRVLFATHAVNVVVFFLSSKKVFYALSYDFQACVCDMPSRTGEVVSLLPRNLETV